jgi:hypothetical protein
MILNVLQYLARRTLAQPCGHPSSHADYSLIADARHAARMAQRAEDFARDAERHRARVG